MRHVILGNGPAGVVAAEALRKLSPADTVTLVGDEPGPPYSRMAIPYLLMGDIDEKGTWLRKDPGHFERLGIALKEGRAAAVDAAKREVRLESGEVLGWDRLLVATGSRPNPPPSPGIDLPSAHPCWTPADAAKKAVTRQGFTAKQVWSASKKLGVIRKKGGMTAGWYWRLPGGVDPELPAEDSQKPPEDSEDSVLRDVESSESSESSQAERRPRKRRKPADVIDIEYIEVTPTAPH